MIHNDKIGCLITMNTEVGVWSGILLSYEGYPANCYRVLCVQNDDYPQQENTEQRWTAHEAWKILPKTEGHVISVGSMYTFPGAISGTENLSPRNFKFIVLENEQTCLEKYQSQNLVKIWIFEDNRPYPQTGVCFMASAAVERLEPMATVT